jgi:ribonuclease E
MDSRVIILLVASVLLAASVVFLVSSLLIARSTRRAMLAPPPGAQAPPVDRRPASELLAGPVDLGGWVPPEARRDYPARVVIPADELDARLAELSSAFEAAVEAASLPEPERPQTPVATPEVHPTSSQPVVSTPTPAPPAPIHQPAPAAAAPATKPAYAPAPAPARAAEPAPTPSVSLEPEPAIRPTPPGLETTAPTSPPRHDPVPPTDLATVRFPEAAAANEGVANAVAWREPLAPARAPAAEEPPAAPSAPEYVMAAPVELVFSDSGARVGIRPGTATYLKYQRLAAVLLGDLRKSNDR